MPSAKVDLTLASGDYEILREIVDGRISPEGVNLTVLTSNDAATRHWRFLRNMEFDIAEVSISSYLMARDRGLPFFAIPVFPHRRFRHGFAYVNVSKSIKKPTDLIGRKVGIQGFPVSASLWVRGILESEYGISHKSIEWFFELDDDVEFEPPADLKLTRLQPYQSLEDMLVSGELDAVIHSDIITPILARDPRVERLFPNYREEEEKYYAKTGIFPIMHVVAIRQDVVQKHPWLPINLFRAFNEAKARAMVRMQNPRLVPLAWYRDAWEDQERLLGEDPWEYGLSDKNRKTLEQLIGYSHQQGLIRREIPVEELFLSVFQGHKRVEEVRI
jgi:4,5-dihydroxyphthalate decarboxylase